MSDEPAYGEPMKLPSGATVTLSDPEDLTGDDFKALAKFAGRAVKPGVDGAEAEIDVSAGLDAVDLIACMLIEAWHIPYKPGRRRETADEPWPLPRDNPALLGKLSGRDYRALLELVVPAVNLLIPGQSTPDDADKPGSPT
jgi:hypothetical protein